MEKPLSHFGRKKMLFFQIALPYTIIMILVWVMVIRYYTSESKLNGTLSSTISQEFKSSQIKCSHMSTLKKCYRHTKMIEVNAVNSIQLFDDVLLSERQPQIDKTIFFIETKCSADHLARLEARQACAVESAARANPNWDIFVLFPSPVGFSIEFSMLNSSLAKVLKAYPNIHMRNVHMWTYAAGTPFQNWMNKGDLFYSGYFFGHTSDFLRLLTLYRFGGIYMDLDVIVQKTFGNVQSNFFGCERSEIVANGVMSFSHTGIGHEIASRCASLFVSKFNGGCWICNGPEVVTPVLQELCKTKNALEMTPERCSGFTVYPPSEFYAVRWPDWEWFFKSDSTNTTLALTEKSLLIHTWHKLSLRRRVEKNAAYAIIANKYCPDIYALSEDNF